MQSVTQNPAAPHGNPGRTTRHACLRPTHAQCDRMHLRRTCLALIIAGLLAPAPFVLADAPEATTANAAGQKFGPYEAIVYDSTLLAGVKVDEKGDVFIMLQPDKLNSQLSMKISMQEGAGYRKWFTGDEVLVAQENTTGRSAGVWSDRIQTTANYIEYWSGGKLFLHLKKSGS